MLFNAATLDPSSAHFKINHTLTTGNIFVKQFIRSKLKNKFMLAEQAHASEIP